MTTKRWLLEFLQKALDKIDETPVGTRPELPLWSCGGRSHLKLDIQASIRLVEKGPDDP